MTKKIILLLTFLCFISTKTFSKSSDSSAFNKSKIILSIGYGYPSKYLSLSGVDYASYFHNTFSNNGMNGNGTFYLKGEYGLSNKIGIGFSFDYDRMQYIQITNSTPAYTYTQTTTTFTELIRGNYHYATTKKLDAYFAIGAGFRNTINVFTTNNPYMGYADNVTFPKIVFETVAGLRYYFAPHFGIYSEIGIAKSIFQIGMSIGF